MTGEPTRWVPNLQIPHWNPSESDGGPPSPFPINAFSVNFNANAAGGNNSPPIETYNSLHRFLSNELDTLTEDFDMPIHAFSSDHFRMFEFKVRSCPRGRSHDWTECPFAHPAEKARRRDPRRYHYSGTACLEFRKGNCNKGDSCEFAHGVFECWLHPSRYRTQLCKDGTNCRRRVCFFAHTSEQLRVLTHGSGEPPSNGSTFRHAFDSSWSQNASFVSSPTSVLHSSPICSLSDSPPSSPGNPLYGGGTFNTVRVSEIVSSMRNVQIIDKVPSASTRGSKMGFVFGSPRGSSLRPGFFSLPSTPTGTGTKPKTGWGQNCEEEPAMERVESGRELRAKIYAKLSKENSFGRSDTGLSVPDIGWVSELLKRS